MKEGWWCCFLGIFLLMRNSTVYRLYIPVLSWNTGYFAQCLLQCVLNSRQPGERTWEAQLQQRMGPRWWGQLPADQYPMLRWLVNYSLVSNKAFMVGGLGPVPPTADLSALYCSSGGTHCVTKPSRLLLSLSAQIKVVFVSTYTCVSICALVCSYQLTIQNFQAVTCTLWQTKSCAVGLAETKCLRWSEINLNPPLPKK